MPSARSYRLTSRLLLATAAVVVLAVIHISAQQPIVGGPNVNMVSGTTWPDGDPFLQRQNESTIAVSTRNPLHVFGGANDYRTFDLPALDETVTHDAWLGVFKSFDGGLTWRSTLLPGYPQDTSFTGTHSPLHQYESATDPVVRAGTNGLFYYAGIVLDRPAGQTSQNRQNKIGPADRRQKGREYTAADTFGATNGVFVARYIDNNNRPSANADPKADPIDYVGARMVWTNVKSTKLPLPFIDKPWLAVDIPRPGARTCTIPTTANAPAQSFAGGNAYLTFTEVRRAGATTEARIMFSRSTDCGATWSTPIELSVGHQINQGSVIAVGPLNSHVYVAWRRFKTATQPDAVHIVKSTDGGRTFTTPIKIANITPFDQGTSQISVRTNAYPTITIDVFGRVYAAWSQRGVGPNGDARIVIATSDGKILSAVADDDDVDTALNVGMAWSLPAAVDNPPPVADVPTGRGHQFMPSLTSVAHRLAVVFYDLRFDHTAGSYTPEIDPATGKPTGRFVESRAAAGDLPARPDKVFSPFLAEAVFAGYDARGVPTFSATEQLTRRHTLDVWTALAKPSSAPVFTSTRLSQYRAGSRLGSNEIEQLQYNPPGFRMFGCFGNPDKCVPYVGDYIDVTPSPAFRTDPFGVWLPNIHPWTAPVLQATWTDNRDVRPPPDGNWANYTPVTSAFSQALGPKSLFDPTLGDRPVCHPQPEGFTTAGMRNQNVYNARITQGLYLSAKDNSKQLGGITRAFPVSATNSADVVKSYRLRLFFGSGVNASFLQFTPLTQLDVRIAPRSSISRTVFVFSNDRRARVIVDVAEITAPGGTFVSGGLQNELVLNPDITNPDITNPDITNAEVYNPDITNPDITNPDITNPDITNPDITNPDITNPDITNPDITNPDITNPDITNPDITNPDITNPDITNPDITNGSVTDYTWTVRNGGNTAASYTIKLLLNTSIPSGFITQLVLHQFYLTPVANNCTLAEEPHNVLIANIRNPRFTTDPSQLANPDITNPDITNATLSLGPGETAKVTLRVVDKNRFDNVTFNAAAAVTPVTVAQAVNTADAAAGETTPPIAIAPLSIETATLPAAVVGTAYAATVLASGGVGTRSWSSTPLPAGLSFTSDGINAFISGTPQVAGSFAVTLTVTDSATPEPQTATTTLTLVVRAQGTFFVTNTNDLGPGSLRQAILDANAHPNSGSLDTIVFSVPGAAPHTITPTSELPTISDAVLIDAPATGDCTGAPPTIEVDGVSAPNAWGLIVNSGGAGTIIRGLAITRFALSAIFLNGGGSNGIECSYLGLAPDGITAKGNTQGVQISGSTNNTIGGTTAAVRNVISGNLAVGINIGAGSTGNRVLGNFIGTTADGAAARGNLGGGVLITAANNTIGGLTATPGTGAGNVISGNTGDGVEVCGFVLSGCSSGPSGAAGTVIQGNIIGLGAGGSTMIGNSSAGVRTRNAGIQVGGTTAGARNVISANTFGVLLSNSGSTFNTFIQGNYIGTDITGMLDRGNISTGVSVGSAPGTRIGGAASGAGNVISGNSIGIFISNISHRAIDAGGAACPSATATCYSAIIQGNVIGLNSAGTAALGNGTGVSIGSTTEGSTAGHLVGGTVAGARNTISANLNNGIRISGATAAGNVVQGNFIGTDVSGTLDRGNGGDGVRIDAALNTLVGGATTAAGNVISANGRVGVLIGPGASGNQIRGNSIRTNTTLGIDLDAGGLNGDGVTANDAGDGDAGPNGLQNFPVLTSATSVSGSTTIEGTLNSTANTTFTLDFYANTSCDPSGHGEGAVYVGSTTLTTSVDGFASFSAAFGFGLAAGDQVSATATAPNGSTSEFSACRAVAFSPATHMAFITQPSTTTAGSQISPAVRVAALAAGGSVDPTVDFWVELFIESNPGAGTLSGTITQHAVNGVATFPDLSISNAGTGYTLRAVSYHFDPDIPDKPNPPVFPDVISAAFNVTSP